MQLPLILEETDLADQQKANLEKSLNKLGELQLKIGQEFKEFKTTTEEILAKLNQSSKNKFFADPFTEGKLRKINAVERSTTEYLAQLAGADLTEAAAAYAVYAPLMFLTLSGSAVSCVEAYNATMTAGNFDLNQVEIYSNELHQLLELIHSIFYHYFDTLKATETMIKRNPNILDTMENQSLTKVQMGYQAASILAGIINTPMFAYHLTATDKSGKILKFIRDENGMLILYNDVNTTAMAPFYAAYGNFDESLMMKIKPKLLKLSKQMQESVRKSKTKIGE